jgi:general secretion pathway protein K
MIAGADFRRQRGVALILVLWMSVLLAIVVGSFAIVARTETLQASQLYNGLQARLAAEAGLHRAVYELRRPILEERWFSDGRPYRFRYNNAEVEVRVIDESGKIDINVADELLLERLFASIGVEDEEERLLLVDAIMDWRDPDDLIRMNGAEDDDYRSAGYPYGAKDGPFDTVSEVQQVMGMNYERFRAIEPAITIHAGRPQPEPAFAPREVLMVLEGMTPEFADEFIAQREQNVELGVPLPVLPDGTEAISRSGGYTFTVEVRATLPSGIWSALEVTVRMGGPPGARPFRILRWNEA